MPFDRRRRTTTGITRLSVAASLTVAALVGSTTPPTAGSTVEAVDWFDVSDRDAVLDLYDAEWGPATPAVGWTGDAATCDAGAPSPTMIDASIDRINAYRMLVGVPASVVENATYSHDAQEAALMMSANNDLDHTPPPTWACYTEEGARGANRSNLYLGLTGVEAIDGYIVDPGSNNAAVGHRWWILRPQTREMGVGATDRSQALWVVTDAFFDPAATRDAEGSILWPVDGYTPQPLLPRRWSVMNDERDLSDADVTVRDAAGLLVPVMIDHRSGDRIVFVPDTEPLGDLARGASVDFSVTVTGAGEPIEYTTSVLGTVSDGSPPPDVDGDDDPVGSEVVSLVPDRFVDTRRPGSPTVDGRFGGDGRRPANQPLRIDVAGRGRVPVDDVSAVVMNITAINPAGRGFLTVWPCAGGPPSTASLNFTRSGTVVGNEIVAKLAGDGDVCVVGDVATDITVDVVGYVPASSSVVSLDPGRLVETRDGPGAQTVDGRFRSVGRLRAGVPEEFVVVGRGGVPESGVEAVIVNVTAINPATRGYARVYPCGTPTTAASVNYGRGGVVAGNEIVAKVSARGTVCVLSDVTTDLTVDVVGYVPSSSTSVSIAPERFVETRSTSASRTVDRAEERTGPLFGGRVRPVQVAGRGSVPASGVSAVIVNVTAINPAARGFTTVFPCGTVPTASSVNYPRAGAVVGNEILARLDRFGRICLVSDVATDLTLDVVGYVPD